MSRPSITAPPGCGGEGALEVAAAPRAPPDGPRPGSPPRRPRAVRKAGSSRPRAVEAAGRGRGGGRVVRGRRPGRSSVHADRAVEQAGVEHRQAVGRAQPRRDGPLAGRRRPVDGDDEAASRRALGDLRARGPRHQRAEAREAGGDHARLVDRDRLLGAPGPGSDGSWRCDGRRGSRPGRRRATRWLARAVPATIRPSGSSSTLDAAGRQARGHQGDAVALLDPQLADAAHAPSAPSAKAAATARIGYSSIIDGARSGGTSTPFSARVARGDVADRLAAVLALVRDRRGPRPSRAGSSKRPVRSGFSSTPSTVTSEPGVISAATSGKAADDGSPGTADRARRSARWPPARRMRRPSARVLDLDLARRRPAASARCGRGSAPARSPRSRPAAFRPASSTADFTCAEGSGRR